VTVVGIVLRAKKHRGMLANFVVIVIFFVWRNVHDTAI